MIYRLYRLNPSMNIRANWKYVIIENDNVNKWSGSDELEHLILPKHYHSSVAKDCYNLMLEFENLIDIQDSLPEEFI